MVMDPVVFEPYMRPEVWGGRRLEQILTKSLPPQGTFGESWEISAYPRHISLVAEGPLHGVPLTDLWAHSTKAIGGHGSPASFPWLIKYLDCRELLSVQVHPDDRTVVKLRQGESGKTEAWMVMEAEPTARIYAGLLPGVARADLEHHLDAGTVAECLYEIKPEPGDFFYLPAGTVHAIGCGILVAEVQQSSDVTFRLFDWNRVGIDGKPRALHRDEALASIDWTLGPVRPAVPVLLDDVPATAHGERMVACDKFILDRFTLAGELPIDDLGHMTAWMVLNGSVELCSDTTGYRRAFRRGGTVLVPATAWGLRWIPTAKSERVTLLRVGMP
jgi:mannose-6-phosphate isomerase